MTIDRKVKLMIDESTNVFGINLKRMMKSKKYYSSRTIQSNRHHSTVIKHIYYRKVKT